MAADDTGPAEVATAGPAEAATAAKQVSDVASPAPVVSSRLIHRGRIWDLYSDDVDLGHGSAVVRDYVRHPGAVAVIALDDAGRVLLQRQYRHPVRSLLWEPPAGLLDRHGESLRDAAARELAEEADLVAEQWDVLVDYYTTPGSSDEAIRIFLARGLAPVPEHERHEREDEERDMASLWLPLDEAVDAVLAGEVHNPSAVVGLLAAAQAKAAGWASLRPLSAPWVR